MNIYEMLEEHLPKKKKYECHGKRNLDCGKCHKIHGFNQAREEFIDVLKRAKIDDFKIIEILDEENLGFSNDYICDLADNISQTNILRIDDEKIRTKE